MNKLNQNVPKGKASSEVFKTPGWIQNFARLTKRKAIIRLSVLFIITVFLGIQIPKIQFDYNFNSFFPEGDEELAYYEQLNESFGEFNDFLFIVLKSDEPTSKPFLLEVSHTIDSLMKWDQVQDIQSMFDLNRIQITPFGLNEIKLVNPNKEISDNESLKQLLSGRFLGKDNKSMLFMLRHKAFTSKEEGDLFFERLEAYLFSKFNDDQLVSGKIQMQHDFTKKFEQELAKLLLLALAFAIIVLSVLFRSFKGVVAPIVTLLVCIIWTMGFISLTGKAIDVMVVIIPAILLIVSLSDVIHLVHKYDEFKNTGNSSSESLYLSIIFIGKATCLTSITTCVGFLSLYALPIQPIQDFGLYTAFGVLFAFIITFLLIPSLLHLSPATVERKSSMQYSWGKSLNLIFLNVLKHRRKVIFVATISSVLIIAGSAFLRLNTSIIVGFQKHEPELEKVAYFDNNFDGYKPFELGVNIAKGRSLMNTEVLQEIEKIENYLSREYQVSHIESPLNLIREINAGLNGGSGNYLKIPLDKDLNKVGRLYYSPKLQAVRRLFQTKNQSTIRLIGRSKDIGSFEARKLNESLNEYINQEINPQIINAKLTGTSYLIDKTDNYIVTSLLKGIGLATLTVSFLLLIFFREWRLVFVSLIPNLIPVLMLFGLMGLFQIDLNISTAIIFTVAFGIAVDDSIHLIVRYYMEKKKSKNSIWAMKKTFLGTGKSIIVTSLIILSGFSLFMTSGLSSPFYLGLFIAITALVALIFDLAVLPILMLKISKKD